MSSSMEEINEASRLLHERGGGMGLHLAEDLAFHLQQCARPDERIERRPALGIPFKNPLTDSDWVIVHSKGDDGHEERTIKNLADALEWVAERKDEGQTDTDQD